MSVVNGQIANETTFNAAFMSRIAATTSTLSIVQLLNSDVASGATVLNVQALLNKLIEGLGTTGIGDDDINDYGAPNYVVNGQDRKEAIIALDTQLKTTQDDADARLTALESSGGGGGGISENSLVDANFIGNAIVSFEYLHDVDGPVLGAADFNILEEEGV